MTNYFCIHSHLYQPPRENPWLERIEIQDSAYPYHDWNMRINAECYGPNAASRILDDKGRITRIVNNYEKISFNFGPTLLDWLQKNSPDTYKKIIAADQASMKSRAGNGNAIAQAYNHMIMPLANRRDKVTQVVWGISSFRKHFNREPEGMWLPETAVDLETLEIVADHGIKFTLLAPSQAKRIRPLGTMRWEDVENGSIDTGQPYLMQLPCGGSIVIFFYNGHIAHEVAFGGLLASGETLAKRILADLPQAPQKKAHLIHIATDGETFGHHHRFGDMALAYAINHLEKNKDVMITNYGEYLSLHPPDHEVQIHENSSWSCVHGVERWRSDWPLDHMVSESTIDGINFHDYHKLTYQGVYLPQMARFMQRDLNLDRINFLWTTVHDAGKPLVFDEDNSCTNGLDEESWTIHRKRAWTVVCSGGHYDMIDFSIQAAGGEDGTPASRATIRTWMKHLSSFIHATDFVHSAPVRGFCSRVPAATIAATLANAGHEYVIYVADRREIEEGNIPLSRRSEQLEREYM